MTSKVDHTTPHPQNKKYYVSHSALKKSKHKKDEWSCLYCGCLHKKETLKDGTDAYYAVESVECVESFDKECSDCGGKGRCFSTCPSLKDSIKETILKIAEEKNIKIDTISFESTDGEKEILLETEEIKGLPMFGGPFEA